MRRLWWVHFFAPDDGGAGGAGSSSAGDKGGGADGQEKKPDDGAGKKPDGDGKKDDDTGGLKSALEKERQARKELQGQLKELREASTQGADAAKKLESLEKKLAEYEFKESREAALAKAIEAATKDGKFVVDREKAARLVAKLGSAATLDADVAEIVDTIKGEAVAAKKPDPVMKGQPAKSGEGKTTDLPYQEWARLKREDPEAYDAMLKHRRSAGGFKIMGS